MTVENTNNTISYTGNSSVTTFAYNFLTYSADHIFIYFDDVLQSSGFTITGVGDDNGGDVVFVSPPDTGVTIRIDRTVPDTQLLEYQEYGPFPAKANERGLDLLTMAVQQNARQIDRTALSKMDKQPAANTDNIVIFDTEGNSKDSGKKITDIERSGGSYVGENPPTFPQQGDRWTRCTDMKGFIWYVDVDGGQWVEDRPSYDIGEPQSAVIPFDTLDDAINSVDVFEGAALNLKERSTGNGGGAMWDVVLASTVTPNTFDIVQCVGVSNLALVLRVDVKNAVSEYGNNANPGETTNHIIQKLNKPLEGVTGGIIDLPDGEVVLDEKIFIRNPLNTFNIDSLSVNGTSRQSTIINALGVNDNALEIRFGIYNHIQDFTITNAQENAIFIDDSDLNNEPSVNCSFERLVLRESVNNGLLISKGFIQSYDNMEYLLNGQDGCKTGAGVTTSQHHSCSYSRNNGGNGFSSEYLLYSSYHGCAADENLNGFQVFGNRAVHYDSCGAESNRRAGFYFRSDNLHEVNWFTGTSLFAVNNNKDFQDNDQSPSFANHTEMLAEDEVINFVALKQPVSLFSQFQSSQTYDFKVQGKGSVLSLEDPLMENRGPRAAAGGFIQINYSVPRLIHELNFSGPQDSKTLLSLTNQNGLSADWSGKLLITASNSNFGQPGALGTATYEIIISKSLAGSEQGLIAKLGLVNGTNITHPSFTFTVAGDELVATAVSQTQGDFWFAIEKMGGNIIWKD